MKCVISNTLKGRIEMTVVICCAKKRLKKTRGTRNIAELIENKKEGIKVIKTYSSIDETFVNKMIMEVNPNKLLILDDVEIRGKRYTPTIGEILKSLKEESRIDIVYAFGVADEKMIKPKIKFLIENGIYTIQRGFISTEEFSNLLKNGMSEAEAVQMYEKIYNEHLDGSPISTDTEEKLSEPTDNDETSLEDKLAFLDSYADDKWDDFECNKDGYVPPQPEVKLIERWEAAKENKDNEDVHCISCGELIRAGAKFCHNCGAKQETDEKIESAPDASSSVIDENAEFDEIMSSLDDELIIEPVEDDEETDDFFEDSEEIFESEEEETKNHDASISDIAADEDSEEEPPVPSEDILEEIPEKNVSQKNDVENAQIVEATFANDRKDKAESRGAFVDMDEYDDQNTKIIGCATIGIAQLKPRTGSTHVSIEIANMLYKEGYDVGICLLNNTEYENLKNYLVVDKDYGDYFVYEGLKYYKSNAYYYAQGEHEIMVNDCGILEDEKIENEYERMKIKIMLCDPAPWNMKAFHDYIMNSTKPYHRTIYYLVNLISKARFSAIFGQLEREGFKCHPLAANDNVFEPLKENQEVYHRVLKSIIGEHRLTRRKRGGFLSLPFGGKR